VNAGELLYRAVAHAAPIALRAAAPFSAKLRRGMHGRRDVTTSMQQWAQAHRDPDRPLLWLHAPSVGEALMAQAILSHARELLPDAQAAFTWFSPSAERVAARIAADWAGYLPWDRPPDMTAALDALQPTAVGFVRTEIWPTLVSLAVRRQIRTVLLNAVLWEGSSRTGAVGRFLLAPAYQQLDAVGAVTEEDAGRFGLLGIDRARVVVTGDARFDQVAHRVSNLPPRPFIDAASAAGPWLVAGSTWPSDEQILVPALVEVRHAGVPLRCIVAPHDPAPAHLASLESKLTAAGLRHARLPDLATLTVPATDVLVVDRVGVLADLYAAAAVAYVGGGFGRAGLHSVVEPAALGVPVLYGPRHGNAGEARRLARSGGGAVISATAELVDQLRIWCDPAGRSAAGERAGEAARQFVAGALGAARRNAVLLTGGS
jgi:3-deoxy-D-manno-octulosonic-acid transferase